jgi:hypothetical protein
MQTGSSHSPNKFCESTLQDAEQYTKIKNSGATSVKTDGGAKSMNRSRSCGKTGSAFASLWIFLHLGGLLVSIPFLGIGNQVQVAFVAFEI